ncbi:MAG: EAL domain-containing response regulator [Proteobacteria bacterium]|nr:EAL domain-containing response regulator [Pseudomonadota bacterium]
MIPPRVLVLDDDPFALKLLARQLAGLGVPQVETFPTGEAALPALEQDCAADLVLVDLNMPGMDGVEFLRYLGQRGYAGSLALVSGEDVRILETAERLAGAHGLHVLGHLTKPVAPQALKELLERWRSRTPDRPVRRKKPYDAQEVLHAIEHGELLNYYQPKVDLATGELRGVETLVRWLHPEDGLVFPDQFIGVAEEHGLINAMTRMVLSGALAQAQRWRAEGLSLRVAVNVSMDNVRRLDFADYVASEVERHGLAPSDLILEVTESRLMQDAQNALDVLTRLRLKRFSLSIDDFGTGHSSLAQLRNIPFDELKIDQSFVHGATQDGTRRAIFEASLNIARQLGMTSVAEGVEDAADWAYLQSAGCDLAQGYFIAQPMPGGALPTWRADWQDRHVTLRRERM